METDKCIIMSNNKIISSVIYCLGFVVILNLVYNYYNNYINKLLISKNENTNLNKNVLNENDFIRCVLNKKWCNYIFNLTNIFIVIIIISILLTLKFSCNYCIDIDDYIYVFAFVYIWIYMYIKIIMLLDVKKK